MRKIYRRFLCINIYQYIEVHGSLIYTLPGEDNSQPSRDKKVGSLGCTNLVMSSLKQTYTRIGIYYIGPTTMTFSRTSFDINIYIFLFHFFNLWAYK